MSPQALHKQGMAAFNAGAAYDPTQPHPWRNGYRLAWFMAGCPIALGRCPTD